ncbi:hypothetical protein [Enterobacter sp.]|uniref:hypothetical protein n=1 Tax=Enterobacter sp. TaxID=42895 RepID=UPI00296EBF55|nr:hypothetical protein [Enterobacter sp.]
MSQRQEELSERLWESHHKEIHEQHMDAIRQADKEIKRAQEHIDKLSETGFDTSSLQRQVDDRIKKNEAAQESAFEYFDKFHK